MVYSILLPCSLKTLTFICYEKFTSINGTLFAAEFNYVEASTTIKIYSHSSDGYTRLPDNDGISNWSNARNYTGTPSQGPNSTGDYVYIRSDRSSNNAWTIFRGSMSFDTSVIPDNALITDVSLNLYGETTNNNGTDLVVTSHERATSTELVTSDWHITDYGTTEYARTDFVVNEYSHIPLNSSGVNHVNVEGYTIYGLLTNFDFDDSAPVTGTGSAYTKAVAYRTSEFSGTSTDPYLEITFYDL